MLAFEELFPLPRVDKGKVSSLLVEGLRYEFLRFGIKRAVIGVSGGIDSALALALAKEALGSSQVHAYLLPFEASSPFSLEHGKTVCEKFSVPYEIIDITSMAKPYFESQAISNQLRQGNVLARLRMIVLYDMAAKHGAFVVGTSNKTELLLGYSTLWGDMASAVNPLGDLYKSQVRILADYLGIPQEICQKPPSADLWPGQSDEAELRITYDFADRILYQYIDLCRSREWICNTLSDLKMPLEDARRIFQLVRQSQFKRLMPTILKISQRTLGREFRFPRDWMS
ncbi:MAG: NAD+ synthase [Leptospiraceae bacterium]|nr:NAD+ synthase [Leptospiraceae bacterium]MDW8306278.1 NAD+ synthase [Leptospiraceae bacterium]